MFPIVNETESADVTTIQVDEYEFLKTKNAACFAKTDQIRKAQMEVEETKRAAKAAKDRLELLYEELVDLNRSEDEEMPLFDGTAGATSLEPEDETWREESIDVLQLSPAIVTALAEAAIHTMGDLANFTSQGKPLTDIDGIGERKAEQIMEADAAYWARRNASMRAAQETEATETQEGDQAIEQNPAA